VVRLAHRADAGSLAALSSLVQQLHVARRPDVFSPSDPARLADWFGARLAEGTTKTWLAEKDGVAVGYVLAIFSERPATPVTYPMRWVEIDQLGVHPTHQREGWGRALVGAVLDEARLRGLHDVRLKTWAFNVEAQAAFKRLGFRARTLEFELTTS
jgi:ribosomal protein S18 acetylase RimI-like enzyme